MLSSIDHIGIAVTVIPTALEQYRTALGFEADGPTVELSSRGTSVQFLRSPRPATSPSLELVAPQDPADTAHPLVRFLSKGGSRLHHICFETEDIRGELRRLAAAGVQLVDKEPWMSPHGWAAFVHPQSLFGVAIELRQHL